MEDRDCSTKVCAPCSAWWKLPALLALILAVILLGRMGLDDSAVEPPAEGERQEAGKKDGPQKHPAVALTIDSGSGQPKQLEPVAWREGMTVEDLLRASGEDARAEVRGSGASALLTSLGGIANEGGNGRNWMYKVNGEHADRSFAVYELRPGDQVLWIFTPSQ